MNITKIIATAGLMVAALGASVSAEAQRHNGERDHGRYEQRDNRGGHHARDNRRKHYNRGHHQRCRTVWRNHHRVRVCR